LEQIRRNQNPGKLGMGGVMNKLDYSRLRVLLVAGRNHTSQTLRAVLGMTGVTRIAQVEDSRTAIELLGLDEFDVAFCDDASAPFNGLCFPMAVRQTHSVRNPMLPVFVFREQAWRRNVEKARDTGATDFITCPVSPKTIIKKLTAAITNPRPFIKASEFFGPDRRTRTQGLLLSQERRVRVPRKIRVNKNGRMIDADTVAI
jgi:two-component system, chemotaxis family, chemotaxis protein CheY